MVESRSFFLLSVSDNFKIRIFLGTSKVIVGDLIRNVLCVLDTKLTGLEMSFINLVSIMFRYYCYKKVNGLTRQYYPSSKITAWVARLLKTYIEWAKIIGVKFKPIQSVDQLKMIQLKHTFSPFLELLSFKRAHPRGYVKLRETSLSPKFCSSFSDRHGKSKTNQPAPFPPIFFVLEPDCLEPPNYL